MPDVFLTVWTWCGLPSRSTKQQAGLDEAGLLGQTKPDAALPNPQTCR